MNRAAFAAFALGVAACAAACGGGQKPAEPPLHNDVPGDQPPPGPHAGICYWAGHLTATLAPMHGDATCFQARPLDVELRGQGAGGELGVVVMDPPASTGTTGDGTNVTVQGAIDQCDAQLQLSYSYPFPGGDRSMFVAVAAEQDQATRRITGSGSASMSCNDGTCHCEAQVTFDGTIVVE